MKSSELFPTLHKVYETVAPFKLQPNPSSQFRFTSQCPVCGDPSKSKLQYSMQSPSSLVTICCTAKCNREFTIDEIIDAAKARLNQSIKPATDTPKVESVSIASIEVNTSAQSRAEIDMALVAEYAESMREGAVFPPMTVFNDGSIHWLSEGFHRYHAYKEAGIAECSCIVKQGGLREAILKSLGSNADHGKRRTNADKKRAVELMLADSEWSAWSDREIAKQCAVSHEFVRQSRVICQPLTDTIEPDDRPSEKVRTATRGGKTYTVNTAKIGKPKADNSKKIIKHAIDKVFAEMNGALSDEDGIDLAVNYVLAEINNPEKSIPATQEHKEIVNHNTVEPYRELQQNEQRIVVCGKQFWPVTNFSFSQNPDRTYSVVWGMGTFLEQLIGLLLSKGDSIESCAIWIMQNSRSIRLANKECAAVLHSMASAIKSNPELFKDNSETVLPVTTSAPKEYYQ